jgi:hypothetical protein
MPRTCEVVMIVVVSSEAEGTADVREGPAVLDVDK